MKEFKPKDQLTYTTVSAQEKLMVAALTETEDNLAIDLANVVECDSAGLALLVQIKKKCIQQNKKLVFLGIPDFIKSLAEFCGVESFLNCTAS